MPLNILPRNIYIEGVVPHNHMFYHFGKHVCVVRGGLMVPLRLRDALWSPLVCGGPAVSVVASTNADVLA